VLHGAGLTWRDQLFQVDPFIEAVDDESATIVVPQADAESPFWSSSPTFNTEYVRALFAELGQSLCLTGDVVLAGVGQGSLAAAQAYCETDLPIDALVFEFGKEIGRDSLEGLIRHSRLLLDVLAAAAVNCGR
jgi:hypothetical protein